MSLALKVQIVVTAFAVMVMTPAGLLHAGDINDFFYQRTFIEWNTTDSIMEIAWQTANAADWLQTKTIAKNPDQFCEYNPILGSHPDTDAVDIYFAAAAVLHLGVSVMLPPKYKTLWQGVTLGCTMTCLQANYRAGIRIEF